MESNGRSKKHDCRAVFAGLSFMIVFLLLVCGPSFAAEDVTEGGSPGHEKASVSAEGTGTDDAAVSSGMEKGPDTENDPVSSGESGTKEDAVPAGMTDAAETSGFEEKTDAAETSGSGEKTDAAETSGSGEKADAAETSGSEEKTDAAEISASEIKADPVSSGKKKQKLKVVRKKGRIQKVTRGGKKVRNEWIRIKGKQYYLGKNGKPVTGWKKIAKKKYFFSEEGILLKNTWIGSRYTGKDGSIIKPAEWPLRALKQKVKEQIKGYSGTWSVYVKDLKTDESFRINDQPMYAASLIKLYAMALVYDRVKAGKVKESDYTGLLHAMITVSDNASYNIIVRNIGKTALNRWIRKNRYTGTMALHDVGLDANGTIIRRGVTGNATCVSDCGILLESIYRKKCVDARSSRQMLRLLKQQTRRDKIPAGLPAGVASANKTGETDEVSHDAAIVYGPKTDYILVVMVKDPGNAWNREKDIAQLSKTIYSYFLKKG